MTAKTTSQEVAATALLGPELVRVVQGGVNAKATVAQIAGISKIATYNIKTDFGAVGDGVTDDSAAFNNFQTAAQALTVPVYLLIPPGIYNNPSAHTFWIGIDDLTITGYGATIYYFTRGGAIYQSPVGVHSARIQATNIGDRSVTLLNPAQTSIFTVGSWVVVCSLEMQGSYGYPPNWNQFEFQQITAINAGTGVISFAGWLRYAHLTNFPATSTDPSYDTGGPASLFAIRPDWDQRVRVYGLAVGQASDPNVFQVSAREIKVVDVTNNYGNGAAPTFARDIVFEGCVLNQLQVEVDKLVEQLRFIDCEINTSLIMQSSSIDHVAVEGCHIYGVSITSAKDIAIRDTVIDSRLSINGQFGSSQAILVQNCTVPEILPNLGYTRVSLSYFTFSHGTFSIPLTSPNIGYVWPSAVVGALCFFIGSGMGVPNFGTPFYITGVRSDGTTMFIDTTLPATLPTYSGVDSPVITDFILHPAQQLTINSCRGPQAGPLSVGQQSLPLYSYGYANISTWATLPTLTLWGKLIKIRVNVRRAYTGIQSTLLLRIGMYPLFTIASNGNYTEAKPDPCFNLKVVGERIITPGAVTGLQSGDTDVNNSTAITAPGNVWIPNALSLQLTASVVGGNWALVTGNGTVFSIINADATYTAATSADGVTWVQRLLPEVGTWVAEIFAHSLFVAIGSSGAIVTSPDGITWTQRTSFTGSTSWNALAWNGTLFCVTSTFDPLSETSSDGITWTQHSISAAYGVLGANNSVFVGIQGGTTNSATSTDGVTWTAHALPVSASWRSIAWNGTVFCVVADSSNIALTSPDGITWTQRTLPATAGWYSIAWNGSVFCVSANDSNTFVATSPDGITWTQRTVPLGFNGRIGVNAGKFLLLRSGGQSYQTSPDGITWTQYSNVLPPTETIDQWPIVEVEAFTDQKPGIYLP